VAGIGCTPCRPHGRKISHIRLQDAVINVLPRSRHHNAGVLSPQAVKEVLLNGHEDETINGLPAVATLQNAEEGGDVGPSAGTII
jgi:hypothetical protein